MKVALLAIAVLGMTQVAQAVESSSSKKYLWICQDARPIADAGYHLDVVLEGGKITAHLSEQSRRGPVVLGTWTVTKKGPKQGNPLQTFDDKATGGTRFHFAIGSQRWGALKAVLRNSKHVAAALTCNRGE